MSAGRRDSSPSTPAAWRRRLRPAEARPTGREGRSHRARRPRLRPLPVAMSQTRVPLLRVENVSKTYGEEESAYRALEDITIEIGEGELLCLLGPSERKSTRLNSSH